MRKSRLAGAAGALTAAGILATTVVTQWEGIKLVAYRDIVGVPTVCVGETRGVKMGDRYTYDECMAMLAEGLREFETAMRACLRNPDAIPDKPYAAFLSLSYNIGSGAFCRSTVVRRANAGDLRGACDAITMWNRAGGKVVQGLVNRRAAERALCIEGLG